MPSHVAGVVNVLQTLLGSDIGGIGPVPLPVDATFPYITVQQVRVDGLESHDGDSGLSTAIIQVNVWDKDYETADGIRSRARDGLTFYAGSPLGLTIQGSNHINDADLYDPARQLHQCVSRLSIWFED